jgi:cell division protein FtsI (penicillin-binding protein 3)
MAWRDTLKRRVLVAVCVFAVWIAAIEARLVHLQVVQHAELVARAGSQQRRTIEVHSKRGEILDRNGRVLAYSVDADTVYAVPTDIDDPAATARALCDALDDCAPADRDALERRLRRRRASVLLKADPSPDEAGRVAALGLAGVEIDPDTGAVHADPTRIDDDELAATASAICDALDDCTAAGRDDLEDRLRRRRDFVYVQRKASPDEARRVAALGLAGVGFLTEDRRYYPNRELAAHLIGYVGIDNQGLSGIESTYDSEIGGKAGQILIHTDARRRAFSRIDRPPTAGATVELTIDKHLQHIVERELRAGIRTYDADAGAVVMLDPQTGEVLALASAPSFNPNAFGSATSSQRRNRAVQDVYEPGSTFKIVTAAAALEEDAVEADEVFDVSAGFIRIGRNRIRDFHTYGPLTFTDVIVKSSNVGAILVGLRLGPERLSRYVDRFGFGHALSRDFPAERLSRYVDRFGFGHALSRDFPAENHGLVWSAETLNDRAIASISMGYQVAVTPLQMAAAFAAIANGGELLEPRVVRTVARNGGQVRSERRVIRRAISRETAAKLTGIMTEVSERGTGRRARVPGYAVAGKTGTAEKLIDGRYSHTDHNASFGGFVPADAPRLVILVMLDTPRTAMINGIRQRAYTGGAVAAPIFQRIAEAALRYLGVPRTGDATRPPLVARATSATVADLRPTAWPGSAGAPRPVEVAPDAKDAGSMPDLRGLSARQAVDVLGRIGLRAEFTGDGAVARHVPAAGEAVDPSATAIIWLQRYASPADDPEALGP